MTLCRLLGFVIDTPTRRRSWVLGCTLSALALLAPAAPAAAQQGGDPGAQPSPPGAYPQYPQYPPGYSPYGSPGYPQPAQPGYGQAPGTPGQPTQPAYPQDPSQAYPPSGYPPPSYPAYPQQAPTAPQPYPGYPPAYPQAGQPMPPAPAPTSPSQTAPAAPTPPPPAEVTKLTLTAGSDDAKAALVACLDAVENYRSEQARARCADALTKDSQLALAHVLLAGVAPTAALAKKRISEANEILARRPLPELERLFAEALLAQLEDRRPAAVAALDALVGSLPGDKRAYHHRGLWRYRMGQLDGAQADFEKATQIDGKFGPAWNALGHLNIRRDKLDDAQKAFEKYAEAAPKEANAYDSLASLQLRRGSLGPAVENARKALELDSKFLKANLRLGDALLFQGNPVAARRAYAALAASTDPAEHHEAAMRGARSYLFEAVGVPATRLFQSAEKELQTEVDVAKKLDRKSDQLHALIELTRLQLERGALGDAGHTIHAARELLADGSAKPAASAKSPDKAADKPESEIDKAAEKAAPTLSPEERQRYQMELLVLRALLLGSVGESALAEERADELEKLWRGPLGQARARELRGDLAARSGDREGVVKLLDPTVTSDTGKASVSSLRPLSRLALAFALGGGKVGEQLDTARARVLMDDLSKRNINDLEGALTRGRARAWLKQNPSDKPAQPDGKNDNKNDKTEAKADKSP